jgi:epsilon-lactone hydrolase
MLELIVIVAAAGGALWAVAAFRLRGADMSAFDRPTGARMSGSNPPSAELGAVVASLGGIRGLLQGVPMRQHNAVLRKYLDGLFAGRELGVRIAPADAGGVPAEWVLAPGADPQRRTLYIHGGAFVIGSPRSHRTLTSRFSKMTSGAVLAIDYRLMPEHPRRAGIDDCRRAYLWMLANGPEGAAPAESPATKTVRRRRRPFSWPAIRPAATWRCR